MLPPATSAATVMRPFGHAGFSSPSLPHVAEEHGVGEADELGCEVSKRRLCGRLVLGVGRRGRLLLFCQVEVPRADRFSGRSGGRAADVPVTESGDVIVSGRWAVEYPAGEGYSHSLCLKMMYRVRARTRIRSVEVIAPAVVPKPG